MHNIQFIGTTPTELITGIEENLIPKLLEKLSKEFQPKQPTEYLTRAEVCDLLKIYLSTLHRWQKKKTLQAYAINGRVYFKRKQIETIINQNKI